MEIRTGSVPRAAFVSFAVGLVFTLSCAPRAATGNTQTSQPHLRVSVADVGRIPANSRVHTEFILENPTSVPLSITEVKGSCSCISFLYEERVGPRTSTNVSVELATGDTSRRLHETIAIQTDSRKTPLLFANITGEVMTEWTLTPQAISFGSVQWDNLSIAREVALDFVPIEPQQEEPTIKVREGPRSLLDIRVERDTAPDIQEGARRFVLVIQPRRGIPLGPFKTEVEIDASQSQSPRRRFLLPVTGEVRGPIQVSPRSLMIDGDGLNAGDILATFTITAEEGFPLNRLSVGTEDLTAPLGFEIKESENKNCRTVSVRATEGTMVRSETIVVRCKPDLVIHIPFVIL